MGIWARQRCRRIESGAGAEMFLWRSEDGEFCASERAVCWAGRLRVLLSAN